MIPAWAAYIFSLGLLFISCQKQLKEEENRILVKVFDTELYFEDIPKEILDKAHGNDSLFLIRLFVDDWVKQQVILKKATENVQVLDDLEKKVNDYRNNLIIYEYQKELTGQMLDTSVSPEEIKNYYDENQKNFELKQSIVRLRYVKLKTDVPETGKARQWFLSGKDVEREKLIDYCNKYAVNTFFEEDSWLSFEDLLKEIPLKNYTGETFLNNNKFIELKADDHIYWVYILSFRVKSDVSPLELETANIRNILINKRKVKLLEEMEASLLKNAQQNNNIKWYTD